MILLASLLAACSDKPAPVAGRARSAENPGSRVMADLFDPRSSSSLTAGGRAITGAVPPPMPVTIPSPASDRKPRSTSLAERRAYYTPLIDAIALSEGVDPALIHAVITQESGYRPAAASSKRAVGLMQIIPETGQRFGLQPWERTDPAKSIRAGIQYLKWLIRTFNGSLPLAIAGYNAGEGAVQKYGNQIPPYRETQNYVRSVLAYYHRYRQHRADPRLALSEARRLERASALPAEEPRDRMRDYSDVGSDP